MRASQCPAAKKLWNYLHTDIYVLTGGGPVGSTQTVNPGEKVSLSVDPSMVHVFDKETGQRI